MSRPARWYPLAQALTPRGWAVLAAAPAMALTAHVVGIAELYPFALATVVVVAYAVAWAQTRRWQIDVGRRLQPGRIEAGRTGLVVITLHNRSHAPSPMLTLRDPLDRHGRTKEMVVAPLEANERISASYRLPPAERGVFTVGPLTLEVTDPLGLARRVSSSTAVSTCIVHPRLERLPAPKVGAGTDRSGGSANPVPGRDNDEFAALREYQPGDDVRRMHWASTARTDTLMLREYQLERRNQFTVVLDTRHESWAATQFERAVSAAASIAVAALDAGLQARVLTTDGTDSGPGIDRSRRAHILDVLATVRSHSRSPEIGGSPGSLRPGGGAPRPAGGAVVVVTSDRADSEDLLRRSGVGRRTDLVVVVIEGTEAQRSAGRSTRTAGRLVRVAPGTELATAWERLA